MMGEVHLVNLNATKLSGMNTATDTGGFAQSTYFAHSANTVGQWHRLAEHLI